MATTITDDLYEWIKHRRVFSLPDPVALAMSAETFRFIAWQFCKRAGCDPTIDIYYWITKGDYRIWGIPVKFDESIGFGRYVFIHEIARMGAA